jgi:RNA polymerase sigma-70 factor (ECF subfamily)
MANFFVMDCDVCGRAGDQQFEHRQPALHDEGDDVARPGADEEFAALLERQQRALYKVAYIYCRDPEERRDLIQEMAIALWRSRAKFNNQSGIDTWTYRVAVNVAISYRRRESRRIRDTQPLELGLNLVDANEVFGGDRHNGRILRELIDGLDELDRALVLLYLEGFDHAEIARLLGTTGSNVGTRLGRIKLRLKTQITEDQRGAQ